MGKYRVTVDTGGTFSDFVIFDEQSGRYWVRKVAATPEAPSLGVLAGLDALAGEAIRTGDIEFFSHGSTVATNALLQEDGARTGLVITEGFRGIYETMEQSRPFGRAVFDITYRKPALLVPESRTAEVRERVSATGEVRLPLDEGSVARAIERLERQRVDAVAVCLLFSFLNPEHEQKVAAALQRAHPEWWITTSSALLAQIREYYRLSTTVVNAYVSPILGGYIGHLERELDARKVAPGRRFMMQSNGGSAPLSASPERAVATILSGPAGGVTAGAAVARAAGIGDVITFDMGGTSCDVALIHDGRAVITDRSTLNGRPVAVPMLDINTVSAGGGTIAYVDEHGGLHVGPESAGAVPGPACYGQGGRRATVTDADVLLGYLNPAGLLGGTMPLNAAAAAAAVRHTVADPLGVDVLHAAEGIARVVDVKMAEAVKAISTERGFDLREFTLIPFGGAGPVHASRIALELGIPRVLVPPIPGATSALGLLLSDVQHDYVRSRLSELESLDLAQANGIFADMADVARRELRGQGFDDQSIELRYRMDMRYAGQGYENPVPLDAVPIRADDLPRYRSRFDDIHRDCHGHAAPGQPVEVVNYRLEAIGHLRPVTLARLPQASDEVATARAGERPAYFGAVSGSPVVVPVYARDRLRAGHRLAGPAIVEQYDTTIVVCPEQDAEVDVFGNLVLTLRAGAREKPTRHRERPGPLELRVAGGDVDPITVEVIKQRLAGVVQEMQNSLFCTGYSTIIRESRDASCAIMDPRGRVIAQHAVLPLHLGAFPACVAGILDRYPPGEMQPGDSFVMNHPYAGGSPHATDLAVISPIFAGAGLIGFSGSIAHKSDIGGLVPGTNSGNAREIFHEGLLLPAVRLHRAGELISEVEVILGANSRTPDLVVGDVRGQVGATWLGARRVAELADRYGVATITAAVDRLFGQTAERVRSVIGSWPAGTYEGTACLHNDGMEGGRPLHVRVTARIADETIEFDFRDCDDQTSGPYNIRPPLVRAVCYYVLTCLIGADLLSNWGLAGAVGTQFREGSLLCPIAPAPVNTYMPVAVATAEALFDALGKAVPRARMAESSDGLNGTLAHSRGRRGYPQVQYELPAGAIGARLDCDGVSASKAHVANGSLMPIEIVETEFPVEVSEFALVPDSGGAGRYRGGLGYVREYRMRADAVFATRRGRQLTPAAGRAGGLAGGLARAIVIPAGGRGREIGAGDGNVELRPGDVLRTQQGGGGGYGDPHTRPVGDVLRDVSEGYVTTAAARRHYGVVLAETADGELVVDDDATGELRRPAARASGRREDHGNEP